LGWGWGSKALGVLGIQRKEADGGLEKEVGDLGRGSLPGVIKKGQILRKKFKRGNTEKEGLGGEKCPCRLT